MNLATEPIRKSLSPLLRLSWLFALTLILLGSANPGYAFAPLGQGSIITVNSFLDVKQSSDGRCTIREAIIAANTNKRSGGKIGECEAGSSGTDTIVLPPGRYLLSRTDNGNEDAATTGDLDIASDVNLVGQAVGQTLIDANGISDRVIHVLSGKVQLTNLIIVKSNGPMIGNGGGILNLGQLTLLNSSVKAISVSAQGGGIYNSGILVLNNSTVSGNSAGASGGGIANASNGSATLNNSTVSGNSAAASGGGINNAGILLLNNITLAANTAGSGGGLANAGPSGAVTLRNTIIAGNTGQNCAGPLTSQGYNLIGDTTCLTNGVNHDRTGLDPRLDPLQNNGGQTETHALRPGSPAMDGGDPAGCFGSDGLFAFDQRGQPRPVDGDSNGSFTCDIGAYELGQDSLSLVLLRAFPDLLDNNDPTVHGLLDGVGNTALAGLNLKLFANTSCDPANLGQPLTFTIPAGFETTDENGYFVVDQVSLSGPLFVTATATGLTGKALQSNCVPFSAANDSWPSAFLLDLQAEGGDPDVLSATIPSPRYSQAHFVDSLGQSRWYKFKVEPGSDLFVTLSGSGGGLDPLPVDLDMTLYGDLETAFAAALQELQDPEPEDLVRLSAQFAGSNYSGSNYSGSNYSGSNYSGSNYSGDTYSGSNYSGSNYSGSNYSGSNYSGSNYSGDAYLGSNYSGSNYSSTAFLGSNYSGSNYSSAFFGGSNYSQAYSDAQERSLLVVSATGGLVPEDIFVRTWNNDGFYYLRVRGRNGAFSLDNPFRLAVRLEPGGCSTLDFSGLNLPSGTNLTIPPAGGGAYDTLILTDESRPGLSLDTVVDGAGTTLRAKLSQLAGHHMVKGNVVNVAGDNGVLVANSLADSHRDCPFAKNLVAEQIKQIIDAYQAQGHPLQFVVLVGGDKVIPYFRHPDLANLANESQFVPPVDDLTAAQAALRLDYFLSDDDYIAKDQIKIANSTFPIIQPGLAVGRLVESAPDISAVIDAFLNDTLDINGDNIPDGVVRPQSSLTTGYDFLADTMLEIEQQLAAGTGVAPDRLFTPAEVNVANPDPADLATIWTAADLNAALLANGRHDLIFLAGHFSPNSALAADYKTELPARAVLESTVDFANSLIFSIGCHAGYNIADDDGVRLDPNDPGSILPNAPAQPDWAQAFASKGATLIAGTGYQYGETETKEYSERLYIEFSKSLRDPDQPLVAVGQALNTAKLAYMSQVPQLLGLHEKALLESSLFGLPMLRVDMAHRLPANPDESVLELSDLTTFQNDIILSPGQALDLRYFDLNFNPNLTLNERTLKNLGGNPPQVTAEFFNGSNGLLVTHASEPFLPGEFFNITVPEWALRDIGFRGGTFTDVPGVLPLTGAPTTEAVALHTSWQTDFFHPMETWNIMHLAELVDGQSRVIFTPVQYRADPASLNDPIRKSIRRQFSQMEFRLFYSNNLDTFQDQNGPGQHTPALSAPPSIVRVSAIPSGDKVIFRVVVTGDPAAGVQSTWVTWSKQGPCPCTWQSLDLSQRPENSKVWEGTLTLPNGANPADIRFMVQSVNGLGRLGRAMNFGQFFTPGPDKTPDVVTNLRLVEPLATSGEATKLVQFSADLTFGEGNGVEQPLANERVEFRLGPGLSAETTTNGAGRATVTFNLFSRPGDYNLVVSYSGNETYLSSADTAPFEILPRASELIHLAENVTIFPGQNSGIVVRLREPGNDLKPLREQGVFLVVTDQAGQIVLITPGITGLNGTVSLGTVDLAPGVYTVTAYFNDPGNNPLTTLASPDYTATRDATSLTVAPPPCQTVNAFIRPDDPPSIWPPNGELKTVDLLVNDPTGQITITVDSIFQDEPVGNQGADGIIVSSGTAIGTVQLRAARQGNGDGRVYHVTFTAADGQGFSCTHTVKIPVVPHDQGDNPNAIDGGALYDSTVTVKFGPDAEADSATTDENSPVSGNVLANDVPGKATDILTVTAVNGQAAAVGSQITLPSNAWLSLNGDGNFTYNPNGQFESLPVGSTALDTFTYQVSDDSGYTDVATVTLTISGVNDAPVAQNDSVSTGKTTPVSGNVLTNDSDIEGDALAVTAVNGQAAGVGQPVTLASGANLTLNSDGNFTYDPAGAFTNLPAGQQATDSFAYTIGDGRGGIATGQVTVTVTAANQAPLANDDTATLDEDQPGGLLIPVTANDTDVDGNLAPATVVIVTGPAKGTAVANPDGSVLYTPNPNFNGSDTFKYTVKDAAGLTSNLAKVTLTVNPVADPPLANDDQATVNVNLGPTGIIDVAANDIDVDGDLNLASVVVTGGPANGTATGQGNGTVAYTPTAGFIGQDSFVYQICDNTNACATATVSVTVSGNRPPDAVDDPNVTTKQGQAVIINVLANDTDPDGDALTVSQFSQGTRGTVTINADGTLTYTPSSNYKGSDTFTYTISDGRGGTDTATVTITISK